MLTRAQRDAIQSLARRHDWRLVTLFGSSARGDGRDVDLAVLPARVPELREQAGWQLALEEICAPKPVDLLVLNDATSPVIRFKALRNGLCLYEGEAGLFRPGTRPRIFLVC